VVTAIDAGRFYGDSNPAFHRNITGLKAGDNITAILAPLPIHQSGRRLPDRSYPVDPDSKLSNYTVVITTAL